MKAGNTSLVNTLAKQLPDDYQTIANAVLALQNNPQTLESFAASVGPTDFTRQASAIAFASLARSDAEQARQLIPRLVQLQNWMSSSGRS